MTTFKANFPSVGWEEIGTPTTPLKIRLPDGNWYTFAGGTGSPLKMRLPDGNWITVATGGVKVTGQTLDWWYKLNPISLSQLPWLTGWSMYKTKSDRSTGESHPLAYNGNVSQEIVQAYESSGSGPNGSTQFRYDNGCIAWYPLPVSLVVATVNAWMTRHNTTTPPYAFPNATHTRTYASFGLRGFSYEYFDSGARADRDGKGTIQYLGDLTNYFLPTNLLAPWNINWSSTPDSIFYPSYPLPAIKDLPYTKMNGGTVWNDTLAGVAKEIQFDLPLNPSGQSAAFTWYVDDVPASQALFTNGGAGHGWWNSLQVECGIHVVYTYA